MIKDESGNRRFIGVYRGIVVDNNDPLGKGRLRLQIPQVLLEEETGWAWGVKQTGKDTLLPPIGSGVFVMFEGGDPSFPVWIGAFVDIPPSDTPFTVTGGTTGTQPTFSGAPLFSGSYIKVGSQVHFQIQVDFDNITNFGTGQYYLQLPFPSKYSYFVREGCLHDISTDKQYSMGGHVFAGSDQLLLRSTSSNGNDVPFEHNVPFTLSTADNFHISGNYITEQ